MSIGSPFGSSKLSVSGNESIGFLKNFQIFFERKSGKKLEKLKIWAKKIWKKRNIFFSFFCNFSAILQVCNKFLAILIKNFENSQFWHFLLIFLGLSRRRIIETVRFIWFPTKPFFENKFGFFLEFYTLSGYFSTISKIFRVFFEEINQKQCSWDFFWFFFKQCMFFTFYNTKFNIDSHFLAFVTHDGRFTWKLAVKIKNIDLKCGKQFFLARPNKQNDTCPFKLYRNKIIEFSRFSTIFRVLNDEIIIK